MMKNCLAITCLAAAFPLVAAELSRSCGQVSTHDIDVDTSLTLQRANADSPEMTVRIIFPDGDGPFPLVLFSHGTFSSSDAYDAVLKVWAGRGYVVVAPDHRDARYGFMPSAPEDMQKLVLERALDLQVILDNHDEIRSRVPSAAGSGEPVVVAGHSLGTYVSLLLTGLELRQGNTGEVMKAADDRFGAAVMLSDPGKMAAMPSDLWYRGPAPALLVTGDEDYGRMGKGRTEMGFTNQVITDGSEAAGSHYLLDIQGLDHYFGGLVHRDEGAPPDHDALDLFNQVSVEFLDAYARRDENARSCLNDTLGQSLADGRAELSVR